MNSIHSIDEKNITTAANSLSAAFMNDPLQKYVFPDPEERRHKSPAHFEAILRYGYLFGEIYTTSKVEAAAVWLSPGNTEVTPEKAEKGGLENLPALLGKDAAARFFSVMDFLEPFHKEDAAEPHWYTMVIGVAPAFWGMGYGSALMHPVLEKAQMQGTPIYLETAEPTNVQFYKKLGLNVVRELTEPVSKLPLWTFKKEY